MPDFQGFPVALNAALFLLLAGGIWIAGSRLARTADEIAAVTGLGQAVAGMLLLGGITSLPEMAVTVPISLRGEADLAVNNILGGVAFQVVVIAVGDAMLRRRAITGAPAAPPLLLQPAVCTLLLCAAALGIVVGDIAILGVGIWSGGILLASLAAFLWIARQKGNDGPPNGDGAGGGNRRPLARLVLELVLVGGILVVLGWAVARTSEALVAQTGLEAGFFGFVFLALATSLPEVSTVIAAVRIDRPTMALGDIFGTNIFDIALIFLIDLVYVGGAVLNDLGASSIIAALLGALVTIVYLLGLIERRDPTIGRLGVDSVGVVLLYGLGAVLLFFAA